MNKISKTPLRRFVSLITALALVIMTGSILQAQNYPPSFTQVLVTNGITNPTVMEFAPDGRLFVAQQTGQLRIIKNGVLLATPFISLTVNSTGERGLLGIAFDPAFNTNHFIYLYYTLSSGANNRISRFTANGDVAVAGSEFVLLNLDPLNAAATNHNGGTIRFGLDGKLYVGVGDNANGANAQNLDTYLGKVLRINSDGTAASGNPFPTGSAQRTRVWSYGLRNPYTLAMQPGTGKVFVNDVGEHTWEEINQATTGGLNFGWPNAEGNSTTQGYTNPVYAYGHGTGSNIGCAITGGTFYNPTSGNYPASYAGKYFYIEYCSNWIDMLTFNGTTWTRAGFASGIPGSSVSITTGPDGNIYFLSRSNSSVYKVIYSGSATLTPVADSYVRSGANANTNYGTSTLLQARKSGTASNNDQMIYMRFDISTLGSAISSAKLRLYGSMSVSSPPSVDVTVRNVSDLTWQETAITYANKPAASSTVYATKTISGTTDVYYEFDITSLIQARKTAGSTMVSLSLKCATKVSPNFAEFNSKEASANKPQLLVTSSGALSGDSNNEKTATEISESEGTTRDMVIYPNPANEQVTLRFNRENESPVLRIFDISGRLVDSRVINPGDNIINIKEFLKGIYILTLETQAGILREKLQVIK